jgi:hypothetical protein
MNRVLSACALCIAFFCLGAVVRPVLLYLPADLAAPRTISELEYRCLTKGINAEPVPLGTLPIEIFKTQMKVDSEYAVLYVHCRTKAGFKPVPQATLRKGDVLSALGGGITRYLESHVGFQPGVLSDTPGIIIIITVDGVPLRIRSGSNSDPIPERASAADVESLIQKRVRDFQQKAERAKGLGE